MLLPIQGTCTGDFSSGEFTCSQDSTDASVARRLGQLAHPTRSWSGSRLCSVCVIESFTTTVADALRAFGMMSSSRRLLWKWLARALDLMRVFFRSSGRNAHPQHPLHAVLRGESSLIDSDSTN
jgi:hypothetical protein